MVASLSFKNVFSKPLLAFVPLQCNVMCCSQYPLPQKLDLCIFFAATWGGKVLTGQSLVIWLAAGNNLTLSNHCLAIIFYGMAAGNDFSVIVVIFMILTANVFVTFLSVLNSCVFQVVYTYKRTQISAPKTHHLRNPPKCLTMSNRWTPLSSSFHMCFIKMVNDGVNDNFHKVLARRLIRTPKLSCPT